MSFNDMDEFGNIGAKQYARNRRNKRMNDRRKVKNKNYVDGMPNTNRPKQTQNKPQNYSRIKRYDDLDLDE